MSPKFKQLIDLTKGKHVHIATHWDCDGVTSGAILYHLLKPHAGKLTTISKGDVFQVFERDCPSEAEVIICSDIQPSAELDPKKVIYIDHHPLELEADFLMEIHDIEIQSCSLLIWDKLMPETKDPFMLFLTLLGYFGDSGKFKDAPIELQVIAQETFPNMLEERTSSFGGTYNKIQLYVSMFNTGKRMHWNGDIPLTLLKSINNYHDIIFRRHPLVNELERYKLTLRKYYNEEYEFVDTNHFHYAIIECDKNIQGVICSRYMKDKPIIVLNKLKGNVIASMRVPDDLDFDAGAFLARSKTILPDVVGGGHEKAGGITFEEKHLDSFIEYLKSSTLTE